jgi:hypothetical protein
MTEEVEPKPKPQKQEYVYLRDRMEKYGDALEFVVSLLESLGNLTMWIIGALLKLTLSKTRNRKNA